MRIKSFTSIALLIFAFILVSADDLFCQRVIKPVDNIFDYRAPGDFRIWTFFGRDSTFGQMRSLAKIDPNDQNNLIIESNLEVNFSKIGGSGGDISQLRQYKVDRDGYYLGDSIQYRFPERTEYFVLEKTAENYSGYQTRGGSKSERNIDWTENRFAYDLQYVDQLELFFSKRELKEGMEIIDSIYQPLTLTKSLLSARVFEYATFQIYQGRYDSAYLVRTSQPVELDLYITHDHRLIKTSFVQQGYRVYLDHIRQGSAEAASNIVRNQGSWYMRFLAMLPHYILYLIVSVGAALFFGYRMMRDKKIYLLFISGAFLFLILNYTWRFLVEGIINSVIAPRLANDGSFLLWGFIPVVIIALGYTGSLILVLKLLNSKFEFKNHSLISYGAYLGAGFGFLDACFLAGLVVQPLISALLLERVFYILFYATAGMLIGTVVKDNFRKLLFLAGPVFVYLVILKYIPLMVQGNFLELGISYFVHSFLLIVALTFGMLYQKKIEI